MTVQAQSASILWSAFLKQSSGNVPLGYALTKSSDGASFVIATTANLAASASGIIHGVPLTAGSGGNSIQVQVDGVVEPQFLPFVTTGNATDYANVNELGQVVRSATFSTTLTVGKCTADGGFAWNRNSGIVSGTASTATMVGSGSAGDVLCSANASDADKLTKATAANLENGGTVMGLALEDFTDGQTIQYAGTGTVVDETVSGLSAGYACSVIVGSDARSERKRYFSGSEYRVGFATQKGHVRILPQGRSSEVFPVINAKAYGASGQILDNDDTAVQAAFADAIASGSPGKLYFPAGAGGSGDYSTYVINQPLRIDRDFFSVEGSHFSSVALRARFDGPIFIVQKTGDISDALVESLVPPAPGNPEGNAWKVDSGHNVNLSGCYDWRFRAAQSNDSEITVEFFLRLDEPVTGSDQSSIFCSSGGYTTFDVATDQGLSFQLYGNLSNVFGQNNTLTARLHTGSGTSTINTVIVVGTTYHVALSYKYDETPQPKVRLFVTPLGAGTPVLAGSVNATGKLVQYSSEVPQIGQMVGVSPGQPYYDGGPCTIDGLRLSTSQIYSDTSWTVPTTKWDRLGDVSATDTVFTLNFDEVFGDDVLVGSVLNNSYKSYIPIEVGSIEVPGEGIAGVTIKNLILQSHFGNVRGGGVWAYLSSQMRLESLGGATFAPLTLLACQYGVTKDVRPASGGRYGILSANCNASTYVDCQIGTGEVSIHWSGASFVHVQNLILSGPLERAMVINSSAIDFYTYQTDSEGSQTAATKSNVLIANSSQVYFHGCIIDGTWLDSGVTWKSSWPLEVNGGCMVRLYKCILDGASGSGTEMTAYVKTDVAQRAYPVVLEDCYFQDLQLNELQGTYGTSMFPVATDPTAVVVRRSDYHEQSGGSRAWIHGGTSATSLVKEERVIGRTTNATPTSLTFASSGTAKTLTNLKTTTLDAVIIAKGPTWSRRFPLYRLFERSGSTVNEDAATMPTAIDVGTVPVGVACIVRRVPATTTWDVLVTGVAATTIDWSGEVKTSEVG